MTTIRFNVAAPPLGCRWCGFPQRGHGICYVKSKGLHSWAQPTKAQIVARLKVKLEHKV